jgi:predicted PurR-regulated permease PerM
MKTLLRTIPPPDVTTVAPEAGGPLPTGAVLDHPILRSGLFAWAAVGLAAAAALGLWLLALVRIAVIPLVLALFPAAVLAPAVGRLTTRRAPPTLAALAVLLATLGLAGAAVALLVPPVSAQVGTLSSSLASGARQVEALLAKGPVGLPPMPLDRVVADLQARDISGSLLTGVFGVAHAAAEVVVGTLLTIVALFFYLRDGRAIWTWLRDLWPERFRADVDVVGAAIWATVGGYIRGQLAVAAANAVVVAAGLLVLKVPLVLPLAALVFAGGLFPIVGVLVVGVAAVLVAFATVGPGAALATLALVVAVHQLEAHVLAPLVQGHVVRLHPLAIIVALTAGAALLGVLGAFVAVPAAAGVARTVAYLRRSRPRVTRQTVTP